MQKGYIVSTDGMNYSFKTNGETTKIFHSRLGSWATAYKGTLALLCSENPDCEYQIKIGKRTLLLNISELAELGYLIQVITATKPNTFNKVKVALCQVST